MKYKSRLISNCQVCLDNAGFTQLHSAERIWGLHAKPALR